MLHKWLFSFFFFFLPLVGFEPPTSGLAAHCANHYATWEPTHTIHTHSHTYAHTGTGIIRMTHASHALLEVYSRQILVFLGIQGGLSFPHHQGLPSLPSVLVFHQIPKVMITVDEHLCMYVYTSPRCYGNNLLVFRLVLVFRVLHLSQVVLPVPFSPVLLVDLVDPGVPRNS